MPSPTAAASSPLPEGPLTSVSTPSRTRTTTPSRSAVEPTPVSVKAKRRRDKKRMRRSLAESGDLAQQVVLPTPSASTHSSPAPSTATDGDSEIHRVENDLALSREATPLPPTPLMSSKPPPRKRAKRESLLSKGYVVSLAEQPPTPLCDTEPAPSSWNVAEVAATVGSDDGDEGEKNMDENATIEIYIPGMREVTPQLPLSPSSMPPTRKRAGRKSTLSREYIVDSDDDYRPGPSSPSKGSAAPPSLSADEDDALLPRHKSDSESESESEITAEDPKVSLEAAAIAAEEESEAESELFPEDRESLPPYPPTDPIKQQPPSTMPLVPLSQVSDLPDIQDRQPAKVAPKRRQLREPRFNSTEYEVHVRSKFATQEEVDAYLASRWLSPADIRRLEATGEITIKRGRFLEAEKKAIRDHLSTFQKVHNVSDSGLVDLIMSKGRFVERSAWPSFWFDVAATVPGRPVKSVVEAIKRMYDPRGRKGMWLPSEDKALRLAHEANPNAWSKISEAVDRSEHDCRDRWRELRDAATKATGPWSKEESARLEKVVRKACSDLDRDPLHDPVPWEVVVEGMGRRRTAMQCRQKWYSTLVNGKRTPTGPHNAKRVDRRAILDRLRDLGFAHENDINWKALPTPEWEVRPALLKNIWTELRKRVVVEKRADLSLPDLLDRIEAGLDEIDNSVAQCGAGRAKRAREIREKETRPSRAKRMKNKRDSVLPPVAEGSEEVDELDEHELDELEEEEGQDLRMMETL